MNTQTANANQVLSWSGTDYEWKEGGSGGSGDPNLISYTYPSGQQRTLQKRLEDYVSIKDFGAVGYDPSDPNDTTDDTVAIRAAMNAVTSKAVYFPPGVYRVSENTLRLKVLSPSLVLACLLSLCMNLMHKSILTNLVYNLLIKDCIRSRRWV